MIKDTVIEDTDRSTFGELLMVLRKQRRMSQYDLAHKLDVHRNTVSKWERGVCLPESKTMVLELARQLQLGLHDSRRLLEASLTMISPYWHVPYQRNQFFTGRERIFPQLYDALRQERIPPLLSQPYALSGIGGIGKTQMALEYAYRYANEYAAVFWISAETRESIVASFELLNLPEKQEQDQEKIVVTATRWLISHSGWLLIFDHVEDLALVKRFLPSARNGSLLFTTRLHTFGTLAQILTLPPLSPSEGRDLLLHYTRSLPLEALPLSREEDAAAQAIIQEMEGLPLALDQAGTYIQATGCSFTSFLAILHSAPLLLLHQREAITDYPSSVTATVMDTFQKLQEQDDIAAQLLLFCAFLAPNAIPEILFQRWIEHQNERTYFHPQQRLQKALKVTLTSSLLRRTEPPGTFIMHRLVRILLRAQTKQDDQRYLEELIVRILNQSFPEIADSRE